MAIGALTSAVASLYSSGLDEYDIAQPLPYIRRHPAWAQHGAGRIIVLDPDGREVAAIPVPGSQPTNVAFGEPDFASLIVTELHTAAVYRLHLGVPGQPLFGGYFQR